MIDRKHMKGERMKRNARLNGDGKAAFWFLLPSMVGFITFVALPVMGSLFLSFTEWNFLTGFSGIQFVGVENFKTLLSFKDAWFADSMRHSLVFTAVQVPCNVAIGLFIAVLIDRYVYAKKLFKVTVFIPYISSIVASAVVWMVVFQPSFGPISSVLRAIGIENPPRWFVDVNWSFPMIMLFQFWLGLGYTIIVFMSGLKGIPGELYEAATTDGANEIQKFFRITVPMISPTTFFLITMSIISSFKVFDSVNVITRGGPGRATTVIAFYIYREAFKYYRMGTANAAAWIMFVIIFIVTIIQLKQQNRWVNYD